MSFGQTELDALRRAYAAGTVRVTYEGRTVEYGSAADLLSRIRVVEAAMAAAADGGQSAAMRTSLVAFGRD